MKISEVLDLQEPLRMVVSYLQLLQRRYQGKLDEKADKFIYFAVEGASRMQSLINDLLEFSRVTTRAREPEPKDCEFILNQVLSDLEIFIKENKATVSHDPLPEVMQYFTNWIRKSSIPITISNIEQKSILKSE